MSKKKEKEASYDDGSYVIKKKRGFSLFAFILCVVIAFTIWLFAANRERERLTSAETTPTESAYAESFDGVSDAL